MFKDIPTKELKKKLDYAETWLNNNHDNPKWDEQFDKFRKALKEYGTRKETNQLRLE